MKKTTFFLLSLLTVFVFTACSDGLDNIEYNRNSDVVLTTPEATATGTSLNVKSSITGNLSSVVKRGFCYSVNVSNPTIKDKVIEADENYVQTISSIGKNIGIAEPMPRSHMLRFLAACEKMELHYLLNQVNMDILEGMFIASINDDVVPDEVICSFDHIASSMVKMGFQIYRSLSISLKIKC